MGDNYWLGTAPAVPQVTTVQVTSYAVGTTYKITVGNVVISTIAAGSVNATALALATAWNASTHPFCTAVTAAAVSTDTVTLTADTAGVPFVVVSSVSGSTGTIGAASTGTANAGPNDWSTAANWSLGTVPVNSDRVFIRNSDVSILWGLAQTAVAPSLLQVDYSFTGTIGLPYNQFTTAEGSTDDTAYEYRTTYLGIATTILRIGENFFTSGAGGSSLIKINTSTANCAGMVFNSGTSSDGLPPIRLKMNHASGTLKVYGGEVGVCIEDPAETGQLATVEAFSSTNGSPKVYLGEGLVLATHNQVAGEGVLFNIPTNLITENGSTVTLANPEGGTIADTQNRGRIIYAGGDIVHTAIRG